MNQKLRFGIITLQNVSWEKQVERWQYIESLGFDAVWLADHFVNPYQPSEPWFEAWTLLAGLATQTTRIRIGTLITPITWRNPAFLARQALTVDHISHGRLDIGLGTGVSGRDVSHKMTGIEDWTPSERVARFREVVEIIDQLLRNRVTTYLGRYYQLRDATMAPSPIQKPRPPITIGAMGSDMLKHVARYADTWNSFGGSPDMSMEEKLEKTRQRNALLNEYCAEMGRDPQTLRRSLLVFLPEAEIVFDSVDAFLDVVQRYRDVGITEFIFYYPFSDKQLPTFERIARDIIPKLQATEARG